VEETTLVNIFLYLHDVGLTDSWNGDDQDDFDSLWDKISDPSPFDYD
jgi:hypothetical protein